MESGNARIELPRWLSPRPGPAPDASSVAAFERLFAATIEGGAGSVIDYTLRAPRWQFLCYLCDHKDVVLHGSGQPDILEFEPRKSNDVVEFGNRRAVYAASDGIWPIYFAVIDRDRGVTSLVNSSGHQPKRKPERAVLRLLNQRGRLIATTMASRDGLRASAPQL